MTRATITLRVEFDAESVWAGLNDEQAAAQLADHAVTLLTDFNGVEEAGVYRIRVVPLQAKAEKPNAGGAARGVATAVAPTSSPMTR